MDYVIDFSDVMVRHGVANHYLQITDNQTVLFLKVCP